MTAEGADRLMNEVLLAHHSIASRAKTVVDTRRVMFRAVPGNTMSRDGDADVCGPTAQEGHV